MKISDRLISFWFSSLTNIGVSILLLFLILVFKAWSTIPHEQDAILSQIATQQYSLVLFGWEKRCTIEVSRLRTQHSDPSRARTRSSLSEVLGTKLPGFLFKAHEFQKKKKNVKGRNISTTVRNDSITKVMAIKESLSSIKLPSINFPFVSSR